MGWKRNKRSYARKKMTKMEQILPEEVKPFIESLRNLRILKKRYKFSKTPHYPGSHHGYH